MRQMSYEGGFQGRTNKLVDGCYSFWQGGAFPIIHMVLCQEGKTLLREVSKQKILLSYLGIIPITTYALESQNTTVQCNHITLWLLHMHIPMIFIFLSESLPEKSEVKSFGAEIRHEGQFSVFY